MATSAEVTPASSETVRDICISVTESRYTP